MTKLMKRKWVIYSWWAITCPFRPVLGVLLPRWCVCLHWEHSTQLTRPPCLSHSVWSSTNWVTSSRWGHHWYRNFSAMVLSQGVTLTLPLAPSPGAPAAPPGTGRGCFSFHWDPGSRWHFSSQAEGNKCHAVPKFCLILPCGDRLSWTQCPLEKSDRNWCSVNNTHVKQNLQKNRENKHIVFLKENEHFLLVIDNFQNLNFS